MACDRLTVSRKVAALALALAAGAPTWASAQTTTESSASHGAPETTPTATPTATPSATPTTPASTSTPAPTPASSPRASTATSAAHTPAAEEPPEPEGDGRDIDFLFIEVEGGVSNVNLVAFRNVNFAAGETDVFHEVSGTGPMVGAALGFRLYWLAVGARFTYASYDAFSIGTVGGDLQLRLPIPLIEPYLRVGFGYAWEGGANYSNPTMSATSIFGWSFDAALGFDIFLTNWLTIGGGVGFDLLNMTRQRDPLLMPITTFHPEQDGDAIGFQLRGFAQVGLHF